MNLRSELSKLKFALGYNPKVQKQGDSKEFIPKSHKAVVTITADFELAWAPRYNNTVGDPLKFALDLARRERDNIPGLLQACDAHNVPITWATVGHLFLESCAAEEGGAHSDIPAVANYEGKYWDFKGRHWFEFDPCTNLASAPEWYGPDLLEEILNARTAHEIGCHTFSHIDCRDQVCPPDLFKAELNKCIALAREKGLTLRSFVHPGHTIGNLDGLAQLGFTSFQTDPGNILGFPIKHSNGLWELQRTMEFTYRPEWSIKYHVNRYKTIVDRAIETNTVCTFWFHPSFPSVFVKEILPELLGHISKRRNEILACTVGEYIDFLNAKNG